MTQAYEYIPLSGERQEIRVLKLYPSETWNLQLEGSLETRSLEVTAEGAVSIANDPFETVSYTWSIPNELAPATVDKHILIDGCHMEIGGNLGAFLRHRRESSRVVTLWMDAICINQSDPIEKNNQIPMMGIIYNFGFTTTIWLGSASDDSDRAIA